MGTCIGFLVVLVVLGLVFAAIMQKPLERSTRRRGRARWNEPTGRAGDTPATLAKEQSVSPASSTDYRSAVTPSATSRECWVAPGMPVTVQGFDLPGGMLYVGTGLAAVANRYQVDPALIDPALPVDRESPDFEASDMGYWPSCSTITPACRAAYLEWLRDGRKSPNANIGYVFLFLYGLERRVLHDAEEVADVEAELPAIIAELERLASIYTASRSFQRYAAKFLELVRILSGMELLPSHVNDLAGSANELPFVLRWRVGKFAMADEPLPVDWAIAWVYCDNWMPMRTAARRCRTEFEALFRARYPERVGPGLRIKPCKRMMTGDYTPASSSFAQRAITTRTSVPDVTTLVAPRRTLHALVEECCDSLDALSRLRGREGREANPIAVIGALPQELFAVSEPPELYAMRVSLQAALGDRELRCMEVSELLGPWLPRKDGQLTKAQSVELLRAVGRAGFGIEPDVRFGGASMSPDGQAALFRVSPSDPTTPSEVFAAASLMLRLGASVANTDGGIGGEELKHLEEHASAALQLAPGEVRRLRAQLALLVAVPPDTARLKKRIDALSESARQGAGRFVVRVALADGKVDAAEVKSLAKMYRLLGLDPALVHADIHEAQTGVVDTELARVQMAGSPSVDVPIPATKGAPGRKPQRSSDRVRKLDMAAVEAKVRESAQVAAMLGEILAQEEEPRPTQPPVQDAGEQRIRSLDPRHSRLLRALGSQASWARVEYERIASEVELMPDGALEVLNDLAFEVCDEPLVEGDDPIELNQGVFQELVK